jgi:hypothetical protein
MNKDNVNCCFITSNKTNAKKSALVPNVCPKASYSCQSLNQGIVDSSPTTVAMVFFLLYTSMISPGRHKIKLFFFISKYD